MILTYIIDIDERLKMNQSQGHKVKGLGHIGIYVKIIWVLVMALAASGCGRQGEGRLSQADTHWRATGGHLKELGSPSASNI